MNNYKDVAQGIVELSQTGLDALNYLKLKVDEKSNNIPGFLLDDVVEAVNSINLAIVPMMIDLPKNKIESTREKLESDLTISVKAMEDEDDQLFVDNLQTNLIKSYTNWKKEIDKSLKSLTGEKTKSRKKKESN